MRSVLLISAIVAVAATLWLPGEAAQPPTPAAANTNAISFEQYRDWRDAFIERRRGELAVELAASDLAAARRMRLEQVRSYYDWLAGLPEPDRNRRFRERFDRIDANHDGTIDAGERAAWRDKQRAFYRSRLAAPQRPAAEIGAPPSP